VSGRGARLHFSTAKGRAVDGQFSYLLALNSGLRSARKGGVEMVLGPSESLPDVRGSLVPAFGPGRNEEGKDNLVFSRGTGPARGASELIEIGKAGTRHGGPGCY